VTVIEFMDNILPGMDGEVRKEAQKILKRQGIKFKLASKVTKAVATKQNVALKIEDAQGGDSDSLVADIVLMAVGRKPYTEGLGLESAGVALDERGRIKTDSSFKSSVDGIYAIGDVIAGPMLAHKAEDEGVILAEILAGQSGHIDYNMIPGVVYTWPEIAAVGKTEEQLKEEGVDYTSGKFSFMANGRARAMGMTDGFVKILADSKTDRVLGAHMIGPNVGELISEIVTVMEFEGSAEDIARTCHAHPTLSEVVKEAALAVHKRPIHS
jgi:dihydrolipoamide dehydrogenase